MLFYGLIGTNISYSLSPIIYNYWFSKYGIKAKYNLIDIKEEVFNKNFIQDLILKNNYKGLNFTQPFKEKILDFVDYKSDEVKIIRAINNIHYDDGIIKAYNTDYLGLRDSFIYHKIDVKGKNILLLGAGGSAKSLIHTLLKDVQHIYIKNRTESKVFDIIKLFSSNKISMAKNDSLENIDIIFNATTLKSQDFLQGLELKSNLIIYDFNYNHKMLSYESIDIYDGSMMLIYQAVYNFYIWFGFYPLVDDELIKKVKKNDSNRLNGSNW